jgi:hypothetical protein
VKNTREQTLIVRIKPNNIIIMKNLFLSAGFYVIKIVDEMGTVRVAKVCKE